MTQAIIQYSGQILEQLSYWVESWIVASFRTIFGAIIVQDFVLVTISARALLT